MVSTRSTPSSARSRGSAAAYSAAAAPATMSTGFATEASGTRTPRSALRVASERRASESPLATRKSVARIAGPPAFVRIPTRGPAGSGCVESARATSNISPTESTRRTPVCSRSASTATSGPASAPVCDAAARPPSAVRPAFTQTTGFVRVRRRATGVKCRGLPKLSRYMSTIFVAGSSCQYRSRSLPETSALLPRLANMRMPRPRSSAWSRIVTPIAPDWERNAMPPGLGKVRAKVASMRTPGSVFRRPMQFGPRSLIPWRRHAAASSRSAAAPASPISRKPAVMTHTPRTPFFAHASIVAATAFCGTAMTARSTGSGMERTSG